VQKTHMDETGVTVETCFVHISGESFTGGTLHVPASKQDPQGYGSALSYARRYSLMAACGIAPEDDDGNAAKPPPSNGIHAPARLAFESLQPEQQDRMRRLSKDVLMAHSPSQMIDVIDAADLDQDEKAGLWSLLDSKTRSAIKQAQKATA
jgi:hypothetical protein